MCDLDWWLIYLSKRIIMLVWEWEKCEKSKTERCTGSKGRNAVYIIFVLIMQPWIFTDRHCLINTSHDRFIHFKTKIQIKLSICRTLIYTFCFFSLVFSLLFSFLFCLTCCHAHTWLYSHRIYKSFFFLFISFFPFNFEEKCCACDPILFFVFVFFTYFVCWFISWTFRLKEFYCRFLCCTLCEIEKAIHLNSDFFLPRSLWLLIIIIIDRWTFQIEFEFEFLCLQCNEIDSSENWVDKFARS